MEAQGTNAQAQASASSETLGKFALLSILVAMILLIGGMIADKQKVTLAFVCGIGFFTIFGGMVIFVLSGQLAAMYINYLREQTKRIQNDQQYDLYLRQLPQIRLEEPKDVEQPLLPTPRPSLPGYVPAVPQVDEQLKLACYNFVLDLFKDGAPDPDKILGENTKKPGQIQGKKPKPEVLEYLLGLEMIWIDEKTKMTFFDTEKYPTLREAHQAIKHGMRARENV